MSSSLRACKGFSFLGLFIGITTGLFAQSTYAPQGLEYPLAGSLPGDQVSPQVSISGSGGYLVWQDNVTDADGLGIGARRINGNLSGSFGVFRVNEQSAGDQENVRVALLKDGGAAFVWQGGVAGFQHIYARFLKGDGTFATGDRLVNTYTANHQIDPAVAVLSNSNVVVTWSSYGQDGSMYGVYAQLFSPTGDRIGSEFQVSQSTLFSQRSAAAVAFPDGGFALAWVGERQATAPISQTGLIVVTNSVPRYTADILSRLFDADGAPRGNEFRVSDSDAPCANPTIAVSTNGGMVLAWSQKNNMANTNSWDVFVRGFDAGAHPVSAALQANSWAYGDQFAPKVASNGSDYMVVWTSLAQDGSREGVYGRFLSFTGNPVGDEIRVNTTTISQQIHPAVASDGSGRFLVVWSSFVGGDSSFDLFGQRYAVSQSLPAPAAPIVSALSQSQLSVTWPELSGFSVDHYEVFVDSDPSPVAVTSNMWTAARLAAGSTHSFRLLYQLSDGRRSPVSAPASGTTWGEDNNFDALPDDWQARYWGSSPGSWPAPQADSDGDGATNIQEFLAGTDPTDPNSLLRVQLVSSPQGTRLSWNSQPGYIYQVQASGNLNAGSWTNFGPARFAAGTNDSVMVGGLGDAAYYRLVRLR
jgi:hypothetical protein